MADEDVGTLIADFTNRRVWAVVGVSTDRSKYGFRVYRSLREAGYHVYAVNPNAETVDGDTVYPSLEALPQPPEVVDVVVPPAVTEQIVRQCDRLGLRRVWLQPGAESEDAIRYCQEHGIAVVHHACAMVQKRQWPAETGRA